MNNIQPDSDIKVKKATLTFIFITVALDMLSFGIIVPILPKLILEFEKGNSSDAATIFGIFGTVFAIMQFIFAPLLGSLSDSIGRRPVILISNLGLGLDYILMALANSLPLLFVGRIIAGICSSSFSIPTAYIADIVPPEKRAASFGMLGAAFGLGFIVGPAFGGLLSIYGSRVPFWVAACLNIANALYGLFILPESLTKEKRTKFNWKIANPFGAFQLLLEHKYLLGITTVLFFSTLASEVLPSTWVLYADYRFKWSAESVGISLAIVGLCSVVVQAGLAGIVNKKLGERVSLLLGLAFGVIGFFIYGLAPTGFLFCSAIPFVSLWGIAGPSAQALMTGNINDSEQGRLQGAVASLHSIANMIGPVLFTGVFSIFIGKLSYLNLSGAPFLLAGLILLISLILAFIINPQVKKV